MRALVTGAGGFIGSHLAEHLLAEGYEVRALRHYNHASDPGHLRDVSGDVEIVFGDVRDQDRLKRMATGCDVIFNLAALISIPHSFSSPSEYMGVNAGGCLNALAAARWHGCRLVQMSTSEVYGTAKSVPMDEAHPMQTQSPYSAAKAAADALCRSFHASFDDCDVVIARPFNAFGPRQSTRAVIPSVITQALRQMDAWGLGFPVRIPVGTLTATRDFTYVGDTARALRLLAECSGARGLEVNVGTGREVSVGDLVRVIGDVIGQQLTAWVDDTYVRPERAEVQRLLCDNTRLFGLTKWRPEVSLRDGIARAAVWLEGRLDELPKGLVR